MRMLVPGYFVNIIEISGGKSKFLLFIVILIDIHYKLVNRINSTENSNYQTELVVANCGN